MAARKAIDFPLFSREESPIARLTHFTAGFKSTLKDLEDVLDLAFNRFPAYLVVRAAAPFKVTPNALTVMSFVFACAATWSLAVGRGGGAALFIWLKVVFDCSDGQMARFTKSASRYGRFYDELADIIGQFLIFGGIGYAMMRAGFQWIIFWQIAGSLLFMGADITLFQNFRNYFIRTCEPRTGSALPTRRALFLAIDGLDALREATVRVIPLPNIRAHAERHGWAPEPTEDLRAAFRKRFRPMVYVFSVFAGTSHLFAIAVLALIGRLELIFPLFLLWYNVFLAAAIAIQIISVAAFKRRYMASPAGLVFSPRRRRRAERARI